MLQSCECSVVRSRHVHQGRKVFGASPQRRFVAIHQLDISISSSNPAFDAPDQDRTAHVLVIKLRDVIREPARSSGSPTL